MLRITCFRLSVDVMFNRKKSSPCRTEVSLLAFCGDQISCDDINTKMTTNQKPESDWGMRRISRLLVNVQPLLPLIASSTATTSNLSTTRSVSIVDLAHTSHPQSAERTQFYLPVVASRNRGSRSPFRVRFLEDARVDPGQRLRVRGYNRGCECSRLQRRVP